MVIIDSLKKVQYCNKSVLTIGSLDGLHKGHTHILSELRAVSLSKKLPSVVITFNPHPRSVIDQGAVPFQVLISIEKKIELLHNFNIDYLWLLPFNKDVSLLDADKFLSDYIVSCFNPKDIIIGYDHRFGNKRKGGKEFLIKNSKKYNYNLHTMEAVLYDNSPISSSCIRSFLDKGNISDANVCLGRNYDIEGRVVKGQGLGKKMGFPTINIEPFVSNQLIPTSGVYCVDVKIEKKIYTGMCNIGVRPTFYKKGKEVVEVHLFADNIVDYYGRDVCISFKSYLREEKKYDSRDELIEQLLIDKEVCFNI